jgi:rod shape-determining protein MreD
MSDLLFTKKIEQFARLFAAYIHIIFLFFLDVISFSLPGIAETRPFFFLMAVYYWSIFRPTLMPPSIVFISGIMLDIISGIPVGVSSFILLTVGWVISTQRTYLMSQSYLVIWFGFFLTCIPTYIFNWGVISLIRGEIIPVMPSVASAVLSIFIFPVITIFLVMSHKLLPVDSKHYE